MIKKAKRVLLILLLVVAPLAVVAYLDWRTGRNVSLSFFYLVPVAFATLLMGRLGGIACCLLAAGVYFIEEISGGDKNLGVSTWNALMRLGVFLVVGILLPLATDEIKRNYAD